VQNLRRGLYPVAAPDGFVVAVGASTGGTQATARILRALPEDFPALLIVQHMPPVFTRLYAENLNRDCALAVREARDGDTVRPGQALVAPGNAHMRLFKGSDGFFHVSCKPGPKVNGHCPSVDELFFSAASHAGARAVGVILTGMGDDGARGLSAMRGSGAYTIGQSEATCAVYGMPREAHERGGVVRQAPLGQIAELLLRHCCRGPGAR
jgi:two-component system chemotaxis response regulator CheB